MLFFFSYSMDNSDISIYSITKSIFKTSASGVTLKILNTYNNIPQGTSHLQLTNTFLYYGTMYGTDMYGTFRPNGNNYHGGWTLFCPAFHIYSQSCNHKCARVG